MAKKIKPKTNRTQRLNVKSNENSEEQLQKIRGIDKN